MTKFFQFKSTKISSKDDFTHDLLKITLTLNSQDFMSNSPYCLPYNLCDDSLENMELD